VDNEVVLRLDQAQEHKHLFDEEVLLRKELKLKVLGLASLSRTIARQRSKISFLSEGDANTKFFYLCHWGHKNFIDHLSHQGVVIVNGQEKGQVIL
jgi:hypothetical protein